MTSWYVMWFLVDGGWRDHESGYCYTRSENSMIVVLFSPIEKTKQIRSCTLTIMEPSMPYSSIKKIHEGNMYNFYKLLFFKQHSYVSSQ